MLPAIPGLYAREPNGAGAEDVSSCTSLHSSEHDVDSSLEEVIICESAVNLIQDLALFLGNATQPSIHLIST